MRGSFSLRDPLWSLVVRVVLCTPSDYFDNFISNTGITNLSSHQLSLGEKVTLSKGLGFVPCLSLNPQLVTSNLDTAFLNLQRQVRLKHQFHNKPDKRTDLERKLYLHKTSYDPPDANECLEASLQVFHQKIDSVKLEIPTTSYFPSNIKSKYLHETIKLSKDPNIVITKADKNLGIVILDKIDYDKFCLSHLLSNSYEELTKIQANHLIAEYIGFLETGFIPKHLQLISKSGSEFIKAQIYTWKLSQFYVLMKIHKHPISSRPIAAAHSAVTFGLSKLLDCMLTPYVQKINSVIKNSIDFLNKLESTQTPTSCTLVALDIVNLYPSIPIKEGIELVIQVISKFNSNSKILNFIRAGLSLVMNYNVVTWNNRFFRQVVGTAMGTNCAPAFANLFVFALEQPILHEFQQYISFYFRFLDDIILCWNSSPILLNQFLNKLNSANPNIKFTSTIDSYSVDFLDITVYKGNRFRTHNILDTKVFYKRINKFLYLPYTSLHPAFQKKAFIKGEVIRYIRNSSSFTEFIDYRNKFIQRLRSRGFPLEFIRHSLSDVSYSKRSLYLHKRPLEEKPLSNYNTAPLIFNIKYNRYTYSINKKKIKNISFRFGQNNFIPLLVLSRSRNLSELLYMAPRRPGN